MDVCKTDVKKIVAYLDGAAKLYETQKGQRNVCRAWVIRRLAEKLNNKLLKHEENDKATTG